LLFFNRNLVWLWRRNIEKMLTNLSEVLIALLNEILATVEVYGQKA
jgi:hypothetical protein